MVAVKEEGAAEGSSDIDPKLAVETELASEESLQRAQDLSETPLLWP